MRLLVLLALAGCHVGPAWPVEPVVLVASLRDATVEAGASQGVGATLVNRSRAPIVVRGEPRLRTVRLVHEGGPPYRRADAPDDTARAVGPYWKRAYSLAYAPEPGEASTLELVLTTVDAGAALALRPVRFAWPREPGVYRASVCAGYAIGDYEREREVCAPSALVEIR